MKIIMIYDQIQSGAGIKDDHDIPLGAKKEAVGPAVMMEPFLKKVDGKVVACLYCGDGTYLKNPDEVSRKLCAMVNKLKPDVVMCGPCFNYLNYGKMAARIVDVPDASKVLNASIVTYANMAKITANYEVVYVLDPAQGEENTAALVAKFKTLAEQNGSAVEVEEWGNRKLAYPINYKTEGYYVLMTFVSGPAFPRELDRKLRIAEGVMRSLIVCKGE